MALIRLRVSLFVLLELYIASLSHAAKQPNSHAAKKPNFVLLMPDQWRYDWDSKHMDGEKEIPLRLPVLNSLQERGTRFTQAYVPAVVCAPSRSCMASLREYDKAGTATNNANDYDVSIPTYFSALQKAGYHTMSTGKGVVFFIHNSSTIISIRQSSDDYTSDSVSLVSDDLTKKTQLGYRLGHDTRNGSQTYHQKELGFTDAIRYSGKDDVIDMFPKPHEAYGYFLDNKTVQLDDGTHVNAFKAHNDCIHGTRKLCQASSYPQELYEDDWTAQNAVTLINRAPKDKPWFIWISFPGPHSPFAVTSKMTSSVQNRKWPLATDSDIDKACQTTNGEPGLGLLRCNYAAEIENLDRLFGLVMEAVKARGSSIETDTVVCAFSDHGDLAGDHNDQGKSKPWQGAVSVPLVCAGPGIRSNVTLDTPMATVDIGATVLDLAGAEKEPGMTAPSFRGLLEGDSVARRNRTYVQSGLQSGNFGESALDQAFDFRLVVAKKDSWPSTFKYVCCAGKCPGAPSTVSPQDKDKYTRLLYDTVNDPFDMKDLKHEYPHIAEELRRQLPKDNGFHCRGAPKGITADQEATTASSLVHPFNCVNSYCSTIGDCGSGCNSCASDGVCQP